MKTGAEGGGGGDVSEGGFCDPEPDGGRLFIISVKYLQHSGLQLGDFFSPCFGVDYFKADL